MSLQRMDTLMLRAREQKIAIGAFECWESLNIQAIAKAAAYCRKPVIFQPYLPECVHWQHFPRKAAALSG